MYWNVLRTGMKKCVGNEFISFQLLLEQNTTKLVALNSTHNLIFLQLWGLELNFKRIKLQCKQGHVFLWRHLEDLFSFLEVSHVPWLAMSFTAYLPTLQHAFPKSLLYLITSSHALVSFLPSCLTRTPMVTSDSAVSS